MKTSAGFVLAFIFVQVVSSSVIQYSENGLEPSGRLEGGQDAEAGQFPWHVAIDADGYASCNGVLIHAEWVLTSGQCVYGYTNFTLTFGWYDIFQDENDTITQDGAVAHIHPGFSRQTLMHDIALIHLVEPVETTDGSVEVLRLMTGPEAEMDLTGIKAEMSGWGAEEEGGLQPFTLRWAELTVMNNLACSIYFGTGNIYNSQMCTSGEDYKGYCKGDEGAPLLVRIVNPPAPVLVGIASFTSAAGCERQAPTVYSRVGFYLDWIDQVMSGREPNAVDYIRITPLVLIAALFTSLFVQ